MWQYEVPNTSYIKEFFATSRSRCLHFCTLATLACCLHARTVLASALEATTRLAMNTFTRRLRGWNRRGTDTCDNIIDIVIHSVHART